MGYAKGDRVEWDWGNGTASGEIEERFTQDVTRTIKGHQVKRTASVNEPTFLIRQDDGTPVLKSITELRKR